MKREQFLITSTAGPTNKERVVSMVDVVGASRAEIAERLGTSDRYARKVITSLHRAGAIFIERWAMIERDKSGPWYVPIYRKRRALRQVDAPRPPGSPRAVRDYLQRKLK